MFEIHINSLQEDKPSVSSLRGNLMVSHYRTLLFRKYLLRLHFEDLNTTIL